MGIDYSGGMVIGALGRDIDVPEEYDYLSEWAEDNDLEAMHLYYDADQDDTIYGYSVNDILVDKIDEQWINNIKELGEKFEKLTGVKASLIGTQNIW